MNDDHEFAVIAQEFNARLWFAAQTIAYVKIKTMQDGPGEYHRFHRYAKAMSRAQDFFLGRPCDMHGLEIAGVCREIAGDSDALHAAWKVREHYHDEEHFAKSRIRALVDMAIELERRAPLKEDVRKRAAQVAQAFTDAQHVRDEEEI